MDAPPNYREQPMLRQHFLKGPVQVGKTLGKGAFGVVIEINIAGKLYAGKTIHEVLLSGVSQKGTRKMMEKFIGECMLMAEVKHPYVVEFKGLCILEGGKHPTIVMERMDMSLDDILKKHKDLTFIKKLSILLDVSRGLIYLHGRLPPIIHRDLTSRNVLINYPSMQTKIADLGNALLVDPSNLIKMLTQMPGTPVYMPPEASGTNPQYDSSLDMFSFGQLSLYVTTGVFPGDLLPATYTDVVSGAVKGHSELARRKKYIDTLDVMIGKDHPLAKITKQCFENHPTKRPTAKDTEECLVGLLRLAQAGTAAYSEPDQNNPPGFVNDHTGWTEEEFQLRLKLRIQHIKKGGVGVLCIHGKAGAIVKRARWRQYVFKIEKTNTAKRIDTESVLKYFKSDRAGKVEGEVQLYKIVYVTREYSPDPNRFCFQVGFIGKANPASPWLLSADTEDECVSWMEALKPGSAITAVPEDENPYDTIDTSGRIGTLPYHGARRSVPPVPPRKKRSYLVYEELPTQPDEVLYDKRLRQITSERNQQLDRSESASDQNTEVPPPAETNESVDSEDDYIPVECLYQDKNNTPAGVVENDREYSSDSDEFSSDDEPAYEIPQVNKTGTNDRSNTSEFVYLPLIPADPSQPNPRQMQMQVLIQTLQTMHKLYGVIPQVPMSQATMGITATENNTQRAPAPLYCPPAPITGATAVTDSKEDINKPPEIATTSNDNESENWNERKFGYDVPQTPPRRNDVDKQKPQVLSKPAAQEVDQRPIARSRSGNSLHSYDSVSKEPLSRERPHTPTRIIECPPQKRLSSMEHFETDSEPTLSITQENAQCSKPKVAPRRKSSSRNEPPSVVATTTEDKAEEPARAPPIPMKRTRKPTTQKTLFTEPADLRPKPIPRKRLGISQDGCHGEATSELTTRETTDTMRKVLGNLIDVTKSITSDSMLLTDDDGIDGKDEHTEKLQPEWTRASTLSKRVDDDDDLMASLEREALFIPSHCLKIMGDIGQGQFGVIKRGELIQGCGRPMQVAVKTIKKQTSDKENSDFLREMTIMSQMVHPNVVRLYGIVQDESLIVMELFPHGDLRNFLKRNPRPVDQLIKYMLDVSLGMHYIAEKGLVHRDLAARNIIVGENEICKITDFGLLRELPKDNPVYVATSKTPCPIRWTAPESLKNNIFSPASDVWSFGVLQWELANPRARMPYEQYSNRQCVMQIACGYRLGIPRVYPPIVQKIMNSCWHHDPSKRPSFMLISTLLSNLAYRM